MKPSIYLLAVILITSCGSIEQKTNYYLFEKHEMPNNNVITKKKNIVDYLALDVNLPEYLNSPYIVSQVAPHQFHYDSFNLWAELLPTSFQKVLVKDLNHIFNEKYKSDFKNILNKKIIVDIERFHLTYESNVLLSGDYIINNNGNIEKYYFSFEDQLYKDGYSQLVGQMESLINKLAIEIYSSLSS